MINFHVSFIFNILIFVLTLFATIAMIIGFEFMEGVKVLSETNFHSFKYFTVDSNVFAGLTALVYLIFQILFLCKKIKKMPSFLSPLKLCADTAVTLTMMTTIFFLAPKSETGYFSLFKNSNLFLHFIVPLLCILNFIFFENHKIKFKQTLFGIIPTFLYSIFYTANILIHLENGATSPKYDWYGFLIGGPKFTGITAVSILLITWGFSLGLWALGNIFSKSKSC